MSDSIEAVTWDKETNPAWDDRERFRIEHDEQAVWAMRKMAASRKRLDEIKEIADAEIERIQSWAEHQSRVPMRDAEYFQAILEEYGRAQRAEGRKTVSTPYGSIKSRLGQPRYTFTDKEEFISWAQRNRPDWLVVKPEPLLSVIKAESSGPADAITGEIIPGLTIDPAAISFTVEVSK